MKKKRGKEWIILSAAVITSVLLIPTLNRKPSMKYWAGFLFLNGILNIIIDKYLITKNYLNYPVRLLAKMVKVNLIYDFLICPYISVWNSQKSRSSNIMGILGSSLLFGVPQIFLEIWAEKTTKLLKYKKLTFGKVFLIIMAVKICSRVILLPVYNKMFYWFTKHANAHSPKEEGSDQYKT